MSLQYQGKERACMRHKYLGMNNTWQTQLKEDFYYSDNNSPELCASGILFLKSPIRMKLDHEQQFSQ